MSLVAQMERDRQRGEASDIDADLPLFAAADAIAAGRRRRGSLLVLLPALLVPAALILAPVFVSQQFSSPSTVQLEGPAASFSGQIFRRQSADIVTTERAGLSSQQTLQMSPAQSIAPIDENKLASQPVKAVAAAGNKVQRDKPPQAGEKQPFQARVEIAAKMQAGKQRPEPVEAQVNVASRATKPAAEPLIEKNAVRDFKRIAQVSAAQRDQLLLGRASDLVQRGATAIAIQALSSEVLASNELPQSAALLASLWTAEKEFGAASNLLGSYKSAGLHHSALTVAELRLQLAQANYSAVLKSVGTLPATLAERTDIMEMQAIALHSSGDFVAASYVYRDLVRHNDTNPRWWMGMAIALDAAADRDAARQAYSRALELRGLGATLGEYARQRLARL